MAHALRWYKHISSYGGEKSKFPAVYQSLTVSAKPLQTLWHMLSDGTSTSLHMVVKNPNSLLAVVKLHLAPLPKWR